MNAISSLTRKPPARSVKLSFRAIETPSGYVPMVQVADADTGEVLMAERIRATGEWLGAMGYSYCVGSNGRWEQRS